MSWLFLLTPPPKSLSHASGARDFKNIFSPTPYLHLLSEGLQLSTSSPSLFAERGSPLGRILIALTNDDATPKDGVRLIPTPSSPSELWRHRLPAQDSTFHLLRAAGSARRNWL